MIKTVGYLISSLSVLLLGFRWLSYQKKEEPPRPAATASSGSVSDG